jgi:hypothetical protein
LEVGERLSRTSQPQSRTRMRYSRRRDTADHHGLPVTQAYCCSSEARQTSDTPQVVAAAARERAGPNRPLCPAAGLAGQSRCGSRSDPAGYCLLGGSGGALHRQPRPSWHQPCSSAGPAASGCDLRLPLLRPFNCNGPACPIVQEEYSPTPSGLDRLIRRRCAA